MKIKAAIFDLDGTLLNTIGDLACAMNKMLSYYGFSNLPLDYHTKSVGTGMKNYVLACLPTDKKDDESFVNECLLKMKEFYSGLWNSSTMPYPDILTLLNFLKEEDIKLCVFTNKVHEMAVKMVNHYFADYNFACTYGERSAKPRKPDPTVALEIADELSLAPSEILFVGDSSYDILTAKNAGMISAGVLWGYQPAKILADCSPDLLAKSPCDIIEFIKKYNKI